MDEACADAKNVCVELVPNVFLSLSIKQIQRLNHFWDELLKDLQFFKTISTVCFVCGSVKCCCKPIILYSHLIPTQTSEWKWTLY